MQNSKRMVRTKTPGIKAECLRKAYEAVFPFKDCVPKNSLGIYSPDEKYKCKRAVCYSKAKLVLARYPIFDAFVDTADFGDIANEPAVWGVCGQTATRANELEEKNFLLCYQSGKRFIAKAIVDTTKSGENFLSVARIDTDEDHITQFLDGMKNERRLFNQRKLEQQQLKRMGGCHHRGRPCKKARLDEDASNETDSSEENEEEEEEESMKEEEVVETSSEHSSDESSSDNGSEESSPDNGSEESFVQSTPEESYVPASSSEEGSFATTSEDSGCGFFADASEYSADCGDFMSPFFESDMGWKQPEETVSPDFQRMYYEVFDLPFPSSSNEDNSSEEAECFWENPYRF